MNQVDDQIWVNTISGLTSLYGQEGNDTFRVNVAPAAPGGWTFGRTHQNGIHAVLNLFGGGGTDAYTVHLANAGNALINVLDEGAPDDGVDTLVIEGADVVAGLANSPDDLFLVRRDFVALINDSDGTPGVSAGDGVERVNYTTAINGRLTVRGLGGNDRFVVDDNSAITTLDGGAGNDSFQIGQIFNTPRADIAGLFDAASHGIAAGDRFATSAVIIGVVVANGSTVFDPVTQALTQAKVDAINAAIDAALATGKGVQGIAWLSNGVSYATTVFGGAGEDVFSVYRNQAPLRLEGEDGNDQFVVRAFVAVPGRGAVDQAHTDLNGGSGQDLIQYTVNAPVSIEGGDGLDSVVVLGTVFADSFVVTPEGVFGAGLNVTFSGVEKVTVDALEGDDTIFVLGTSPTVVTTVIGGLGTDRIEVLGDVTEIIRSNDLLGGSSSIGHAVGAGSDPLYQGIGIDGLRVRVLDPAAGQLISLTESGGRTRVTEAGSLVDSYDVRLLASPTGPVYLTVSGGTASTRDQALGGDSVELSLNPADPTSWTKALVLVFDDGNWNTPITVYVRAAADTAAEGVRVVMVSHSAISSDARFGGIILRDVAVSVIDDDRGEVLVTEIDPSTTNEDYSTTVLEGGFTDTIQLALTRAPELGETVTVNLLQNGLATGDLTFWLGATQVTSVQFTSLNWSTGVALTVKAFDDSVFENLETIVVTYTATSSNAGSAFAGMAGNVAEVTVYDNENPGVIVRESDGNTTVTVGGATDTYELFLTRAPGSDISITIATDGRSLIRLAGSGGAFASTLTVTFAAATWTVDSGIEIEVQGVPAPAGSADRLSFPYQPHVLDRVRGPLVVLGGPSPGAVYALVRGVTLPTETDDRTVNESQVSSGSGVDDASVDKLDVFHDGSRADSTGALTYRQAPGAGIALQNPGYAITGFGMGGDLVLDRGTPAAPDLLRFGGGITYTGFEVVEVLLGQKKENATIDATAANVVTVVHGGGDADTFTVLDNGGSNVVAGPLILYGDTSQNGLLSGGRYSGTSGVASVNALLFSNPGNDTINGAGTNAVLTIFGGPGNDILAGGRAGDQIAGGTGSDWIFGQAGDDHIYGDSEFNVDIGILVQLLRNPALATEALEIVRGATPGSDLIRGDEGNDFILGDHGEITQTPGTRRIFSTANVVAITTTNPSLGAADAIYGGAGDDAILGGNGGDWLYGGNSTGPLATPFATQLVAVATSAATFGGGKFGVLRGVAITTTDRDLILGDNGRILWTTAFARELLETSDTADSTGAADVIEGNEDADVIAAGIGGDTVDAGAGNDVVVGDHARLEYQAASGALLLVTPIANELGGDDQIRGGAGEDILLGGTGHDAIDGGAGRDLVFGDNASLDRRTHLNNFTSRVSRV